MDNTSTVRSSRKQRDDNRQISQPKLSTQSSQDVHRFTSQSTTRIHKPDLKRARFSGVSVQRRPSLQTLAPSLLTNEFDQQFYSNREEKDNNQKKNDSYRQTTIVPSQIEKVTQVVPVSSKPLNVKN